MLLSEPGSRDDIINVQRMEYYFLVSFRFKKYSTRHTKTWDETCSSVLVRCQQPILDSTSILSLIHGMLDSLFGLAGIDKPCGSFSICGIVRFLALPLRVSVRTDCKLVVKETAGYTALSLDLLWTVPSAVCLGWISTPYVVGIHGQHTKMMWGPRRQIC